MLKIPPYNSWKKVFICAGICLIVSCTTPLTMPAEFEQKVITTPSFPILSFTKLNASNLWVRVYIEGDGFAFNAHGRASSDPTPRNTLVRRLAFGDPHPNVIYLARPCQYINNTPSCTRAIWTNERFSPAVIQSEIEALKKLIGDREVVLIGFSGGAQVAGLMSTDINPPYVKKIVSIAGNLDHRAWTQMNKLPPLEGSLNLLDRKSQYSSIPQIHFVGQKDTVVNPQLTEDFLKDPRLIRLVKEASHNDGWDSVFQEIWSEN